MLKNKNVQKFFLKSLIILIIIIIISIISSFLIFKSYSHILVKSNNKIINQIIKKHPELEEEIIESLLTGDDTNNDLITQYGIGDNYIYELKEFKIFLIVSNCSIILLSIIMAIVLFITYIKKKIQSYLKYQHLLIEY